MKEITFVTGGGRSGKSRYALSLAQSYQGKRVFVATSEPFDDEMRMRIRKHREERRDSFITIEAPLDPGGALASLSSGVEVVVIDCLTVWLGNLMYRQETLVSDAPEILKFIGMLDNPPCDLIVVSNEVGMGIIPENAMARRFRDLAGALNQRVAEHADRVILMVSGIPVFVKGGSFNC